MATIRRKQQRELAGRTFVVLFICSGIAFFGLLAGGDHSDAVAVRGANPMAGYYAAGMPRYPGSQEMPAGPASEVGGTRVRMSFFTTKDEPAKVGRFYENYWLERKLFVNKDVTHVGGVVSAVDQSGGRVFQAMIMRRNQRTMVFPSVTRSPLEADNSAGHQPKVPLFPDSKAVITLASKEGDTQALVTLSVNNGTLKDNMAHYERELRAAGYHKETLKQPAELGPEQRILLFRNESGEVTVNLTAMGERRTRVHLMEIGS